MRSRQECWPLQAFIISALLVARISAEDSAPDAVEGDLFLINGASASPFPTTGVLMVQHSGEWRPVCDDGFGAAEAHVACGQLLGFPEWYGPGNAGHVVANEFWAPDLPSWLDQVACNGTETRLVDCAHAAWGVSDCALTEAVALNCPAGPKEPPAPSAPPGEEQLGANVGSTVGELRLVGGSTPSEGRLEVAYRQQWGTVCGFMFGPEDARVACRALGLPHEGAQVLDARVFSQLGTPGDLGSPAQAPPIWLDNLGCSGTETSLAQCPSNGWGVSGCTHLQNVGLRCAVAASSDAGTATRDSEAGLIRLRLDSPPSGGRVAGVVEVLHEGTWGRICLTPATTAATYAVLCRELGYAAEGAAPEPGLSRDLKHRTTYRPFWLADVACGGGEASVRHCRSLGWGAHSCDPLGFHEQPLALSCALPAGADGTDPSPSAPALATPPVIPPPARTGANETAVCSLTLLGRGSAEELSQASGFGEDSQLLSASLHCRTASGAPLPVAAGKRLRDLLTATPGAKSGVTLTTRMQAGNDTALDEEWGLTFSGLEALALVDSVVRDIRLSRAGPLLQFVDCATLSLTNLNMTNCLVTGNTVVYGGAYDTSWHDTAVSNPTYFTEPTPCVRETVGYGAIVVTSDDAPDATLHVVLESTALDFNGGHRGAALTVLTQSLQAETGQQLTIINGSLVGNTVRAHEALWWPEWPCDASFSGGALYLASSVMDAIGRVTLSGQTRALRNQAARDGGFLYTNMRNLTLSGGSQLALNDATCGDGGAAAMVSQFDEAFSYIPQAFIYVSNGSAVDGNRAAGDGGAIHVSWAAVMLLEVSNGSSVSGNTARGPEGGGALHVGDGVLCYLVLKDGARVCNNTATAGNGGAFALRGYKIQSEELASVYAATLVLAAGGSGTAMGGNRAAAGQGGFGSFVNFQDTQLVLYGGAELSYNYALGHGGAIRALPMPGGRFNLSMTDSSVAGNACGVDGITSDGGAFWLTDGGVITVSNSTLTDNAASGRGGALSVTGPLWYAGLYGSTLSGNTAGKSGGAMVVQHPGVEYLEVSGCRLLDNTATVSGGAVALMGTYAGSAAFWNTTIEGNRALTGDGGAIDWQVSLPDAHPTTGDTLVSPLLNLTATTLRNNQASYGQGGGLFVRPRALTLPANAIGPRPNMTILIRNGSLFEGNTAAGSGAGLNLLASRQELDVFVSVDQSWFVSNRAGDSVSSVTGSGASGGGISMGFTGSVDAGSPSACGLLLRGSTFYGNRCGGGHGGAVRLISCTANVTDTLFQRDTASLHGGSIYVTEEEVLRAPGGGSTADPRFSDELPKLPGANATTPEASVRRRLAGSDAETPFSTAPYGAPYVPYSSSGQRYELHVLGSRFVACAAVAGDGGAVYIKTRGPTRFVDTAFSFCSAGMRGGALASTFSLLNATSDASTSSPQKGSTNPEDASVPRLEVSGGSFVENTADADGGALAVGWAGAVRVRRARFERNAAGHGENGRGTGGAIALAVSAVDQADVLRAFARLSSGGGGVDGGGNSAGGSAGGGGGGGAAMVLEVEGSAFVNNSCTSSEGVGGGAVMALWDSTGAPDVHLPLRVSFSACQLSGNVAHSGSGGALFAAVWRDPAASRASRSLPNSTAASSSINTTTSLPSPLVVEFKHCEVARNMADQQGGAIKVIRPRHAATSTSLGVEAPARLLILNSSLTASLAESDGGAVCAMLDDGQVEIAASSLVGNLCGGQLGACGGGALHVSSAAAVAIQHSLIANNQATLGGGLHVASIQTLAAAVAPSSTPGSGTSAGAAAAALAPVGTALLMYGTTVRDNAAVLAGLFGIASDAALRGGGLYLEGAVAAALLNCNLTVGNDADWGAALASTQKCPLGLGAPGPGPAASAPSPTAPLPWSGAVARSAVWTWALLERARGVGCWMLGLYNTLLPSIALGVLKDRALGNKTTAAAPTAPAPADEQTPIEDATGMPLYLTDTSASSLAVSCRPEDTGAAAPSVVPASASGNVSQQLATTEAGLWRVAESFLGSRNNVSSASAPLTSATNSRRVPLLSALDRCRELSYNDSRLPADRMQATLQDNSVAYLGLSPWRLQLGCVVAKPGSAAVVLPYTGPNDTARASTAAATPSSTVECMGPSSVTGTLAFQAGALYDIEVEMVNGLGQRITATEALYELSFRIEADLPPPLAAAAASAPAVKAALGGGGFAVVQARALSAVLSGGVARYSQVGISGWPGRYVLVVTPKVLLGEEGGTGGGAGGANASSRGVPELRVPAYLTPCNLGERLDARRSLQGTPPLTSCFACTDEQFSLWRDTRPDLQALVASRLAAQPDGAPVPALLAAVAEMAEWVGNTTEVSVCSNCPEGAFCPGSAFVVPLPGYWHSAANSTQMHRCVEEDACTGWPEAEAAPDNPTSASASGTSPAPPSPPPPAKAGSSSKPENDERVKGLQLCQTAWYGQWPHGASLPAARANGSSAGDTSSGGGGGGKDEGGQAQDKEEGKGPAACLLWGLDEHDPDSYMQQQCADGYGGRLCSVCQQGYFGSLELSCDKCLSVSRTALLGVLQFLVSVVLCLYTVWTNLREGTAEEVEAAVRDHSISAGDVVKAVLVHIQIFITVTRLNMGWPGIIERFQATLRSAAGAEGAVAYSPSCLFPEADAAEAARVETLTGLLQPVVVMATVAVVWVGRWLVVNRHRWLQRPAPGQTAAELPAASGACPEAADQRQGDTRSAETAAAEGWGRKASEAAGHTAADGTATLAVRDTAAGVDDVQSDVDAPPSGAHASPSSRGAASASAPLAAPPHASTTPATAPLSPPEDPTALRPLKLRLKGASKGCADDGSDGPLSAVASPRTPAALPTCTVALTATAGGAEDGPGSSGSARGGSARSGASAANGARRSGGSDGGSGGSIGGSGGSGPLSQAHAVRTPMQAQRRTGVGKEQVVDAPPLPLGDRGAPPTPAKLTEAADADVAAGGRESVVALKDVAVAVRQSKDGSMGPGGREEWKDGKGPGGEEGAVADEDESERPSAKATKVLKELDSHLSLPRQLSVVATVVVFILYSGWSQAALSIFACYALDDGTGPYPELQQAAWVRGYWMRNMDLACYAGEHATLYVPLGIVAVLLVCAGPPIASAVILYRHKDCLDDRRTQLVYGFMYTRYKRQWWWWESVVQLQMLALVVVDVFGRALSLEQQALTMLLSMTVISALNAACSPLHHPTLGLLDFVSMAVLSATVMMGLFAADMKDDKNAEKEIIGVCIVVINAALLAAFVALIAYSSRRALSSAARAASARAATFRSASSRRLQRMRSSGVRSGEEAGKRVD
ncbi:hypothetical protein HYH03_001236 [Edaphochlamys debaryana]|uniref:SRCR domain-containing protein n=1 Tax=Edaphochlamys debaryana TaxID=47281 RepID=A0A835YI95_9CHLO|nr:hypothetical protein HYH03_001236 [Edaphochlamys debaryana]|eukprot:KAG2501456.1 hypothetical protein HYH03_001236 [Edaphochlamys debaryana]